MDSSSSSISPPPDKNDVAVLPTGSNNHPSGTTYPEMIYKALEELNEKDGSSKASIGKYIEEKVYSNNNNLSPPPEHHMTLLSEHLNHLNKFGLLILVNNSNYKLPPYLPTTLTLKSQTPNPNPPPPVVLALPDHHPGSTFPKRKIPKNKNKNKNAPSVPPPPPPPVDDDVVVVVDHSRPINPAVARPKEAKAATPAQNVADEDLRRKFEHFQSKVRKSLFVLKPYFNHESPVTTIAAIKELEILANLDFTAPLRDGTQQFP